MTGRGHLLLPLAALLAVGCAGSKPDTVTEPDEAELVEPASVEADIAPAEATPVEQAEVSDGGDELEKAPLLLSLIHI